MQRYNRVAAIFFVFVGIFCAVYARGVEIGTWTEPGPGFLPFWAGLTLLAMGLILFLRSYPQLAGSPAPSFFPQPDSWKRVSATFLSLIAYNLLLYRTGRLWPCIFAHGITNLILGVHVIITGESHWW